MAQPDKDDATVVEKPLAFVFVRGPRSQSSTDTTEDEAGGNATVSARGVNSGEGNGDRQGIGNANANADADNKVADAKSNNDKIRDLDLCDEFLKNQKDNIDLRPLRELLEMCAFPGRQGNPLKDRELEVAEATLRDRIGALWTAILWSANQHQGRLLIQRNSEEGVQKFANTTRPQLTLDPDAAASIVSPDTPAEAIIKLEKDNLARIEEQKVEHVRVPDSSEYSRVVADVEKRWRGAALAGLPFRFAFLDSQETVRAIALLPGKEEQAIIHRWILACQQGMASHFTDSHQGISSGTGTGNSVMISKTSGDAAGPTGDSTNTTTYLGANANTNQTHVNTTKKPTDGEDSEWWKMGRLDPNNQIIHGRYAIKDALYKWGPTVKRLSKGDRTRKPKISDLVWSHVQAEVSEEVFKKHFDSIYASWRRREKSEEALHYDPPEKRARIAAESTGESAHTKQTSPQAQDQSSLGNHISEGMSMSSQLPRDFSDNQPQSRNATGVRLDTLELRRSQDSTPQTDSPGLVLAEVESSASNFPQRNNSYTSQSSNQPDRTSPSVSNQLPDRQTVSKQHADQSEPPH
mmetsp:Transcript_18397/g.31975  ORF Transcript_18397/g.31975 Transcript_18397/m.31975 type:complete len:578 (-) Transcript_18397:78-1811(-)